MFLDLGMHNLVLFMVFVSVGLFWSNLRFILECIFVYDCECFPGLELVLEWLEIVAGMQIHMCFYMLSRSWACAGVSCLGFTLEFKFAYAFTFFASLGLFWRASGFMLGCESACVCKFFPSLGLVLGCIGILTEMQLSMCFVWFAGLGDVLEWLGIILEFGVALVFM